MTNADLPESLRAVMEGAAPPDDFVSNGCSCCPDEYGGVDLRPACHWHDYAYSIGGDEPARKKADQAFYRNLRRCDLGRLMAGIYYRRVRLFGMRHWPYVSGTRPRGVWPLVVLLIDRYIRFVLMLAVVFGAAGALAAGEPNRDAVVWIGNCSGVCVHPSGLVLTAKHCRPSDTTRVQFGERTFPAQLWYEPPGEEGVVVLRVDAGGEPLPSVPIAPEAPKPGDKVAAIGYPGGQFSWLEGRVTRAGEQVVCPGCPRHPHGFKQSVIETDFRVWEGNSGGPLFNFYGELVGIASTRSLTAAELEVHRLRTGAAVDPNQAAPRSTFLHLEQIYAALESPPVEAPANAAGDVTKPLLLVFTVPLCGPCIGFKTDWQWDAQFRARICERFRVRFVDGRRETDLVAQYGVRVFPSFRVVDADRNIEGYRGKDWLIAHLNAERNPISPRKPQPGDVPENRGENGSEERPSDESDDAVRSPERRALDETPAESRPPVTPPSNSGDRLDRLLAGVQTALTLATWLGVTGATGGAAGAILGGLVLWRRVRRRRSRAREPTAGAHSSPAVIATESPPPPPRVIRETRFAPYERDTFAEAYAWGKKEFVQKYPGSVGTIEVIDSLIEQYLASKGERLHGFSK